MDNMEGENLQRHTHLTGNKQSTSTQSGSGNRESQKRRMRNQWKIMKRRMDKYLHLSRNSPPAIIAMTLIKDRIEWTGPKFMEKFANDPHVRKAFIQAAKERPLQMNCTTPVEEKKSSRYKLPYKDAEIYSGSDLMKIIPKVINPKGVKNFWKPSNKPFWWPDGLTFQSPNHPKVGGKFSAEELRQIFTLMVSHMASHLEFTCDQRQNHVTETSQPINNQRSTNSDQQHPWEHVKNILNKDDSCIEFIRQLHGRNAEYLKTLNQVLAVVHDFIKSKSVPWFLDRSKLIKRYQQILPDFYPMESSLDGHCLYSSISILLCAKTDLKFALRLAGAIFGLIHKSHIVNMLESAGYRTLADVQGLCHLASTDQIMEKIKPDTATDASMLLHQLIEEEAVDTLNLSRYSGWLQVVYVAGFLNINIQQHIEEFHTAVSSIYSTLVQPCACSKASTGTLHIQWVNNGQHIIPLVPKYQTYAGTNFICTFCQKMVPLSTSKQYINHLNTHSVTLNPL